MDLGKFEGVCLDSICVLLVLLVDVYFLDFLFLFALLIDYFISFDIFLISYVGLDASWLKILFCYL